MTATLASGTIFAGRYRVVRCIAVGGMGTVYEAVHLGTERRRALKVMHPHLFDSDEMRERFEREARILAHVESEHLVDVSDAGVDEATGAPFLVMELLRGEELGARLKRRGRLPPGEVLAILREAALALDHTHASAIVHRDLKPENLFLTAREDGRTRLKILDFGVAKLVAEGGATCGTTRSVGTPLYMAPEQFRVGAGLSPAADIYALGMMAYTLLVGEAYWSVEAYAAGDVIAFAMVAVHGPKEPPTRRAAACGAALPRAFDAWFFRMTAADPRARFPTATAGVRALGDALAPTPPDAKRQACATDAPVSRTAMDPSRGSGVAATVLLGLLAVAAGAWLAPRAPTDAIGLPLLVSISHPLVYRPPTDTTYGTVAASTFIAETVAPSFAAPLPPTAPMADASTPAPQPPPAASSAVSPLSPSAAPAPPASARSAPRAPARDLPSRE